MCYQLHSYDYSLYIIIMFHWLLPKKKKFHWAVVLCTKEEEGEGMRKQVVLAKPFSLEDEKYSEHTSNLIQRILSLFKNVRPGSDVTNFQVCNSLFTLYVFASLSILGLIISIFHGFSYQQKKIYLVEDKIVC